MSNRVIRVMFLFFQTEHELESQQVLEGPAVSSQAREDNQFHYTDPQTALFMGFHSSLITFARLKDIQ